MVCGLGRFGLQVVYHLHQRGVPTVVITYPETRADRIAQAEAQGARILIGDFRFATTRAEADVPICRALFLTSPDNEANLEAALDVRNERPELPILMRLSEEKLAYRLREDFGIDAYAPPTLAAEHFIDAALGEAVVEPVKVGRVFPKRRKSRASARLAAPLWLALALITLFVSGVVIFSRALNISPVDAAYFTATTLTTVGFGDFNLQHEPAPVKFFGITLMFGGVFLIAGLSSLFTTFVVSGTVERLWAEARARTMRGHVIVCGLGSVGEAIAIGLRERGEKVVILDTEPIESRVHDAALHLPVLIGDATRPEALLQAGFLHAKALVAAVSSDAVNLEIGLTARTLVEELRPERPLRLVLRCFDPEMENRIRAVSKNYVLLSSARIAAPLFVEKALSPTLTPQPPLPQEPASQAEEGENGV